MACKLCRIIVYHKHPRYQFFSFLHHPGVLMVEGQEAQDTWTSTSCRSELQRGCHRVTTVEISTWAMAVSPKKYTWTMHITLLLSSFEKHKGLHFLQLYHSLHIRHEPWQNSIGLSYVYELLEFMHPPFIIGNYMVCHHFTLYCST